MTYESKIRKVGTSNGFIIPSMALKMLNLKEGDKVDLVIEEDGIKIVKKIIKD